MRCTYLIYTLIVVLTVNYCFLILTPANASTLYSKTFNTNKADESQYISNFIKLWNFLEQKNTRALKQYCRNSDPAYKVICNLLVYLVEDKQNPRSFLQNSPKTEKDIEWLWRWDIILMRSQDDKILKLFSSGFAFRYIDEIFLLIERIPEIAIDCLLTFNYYADGEYAEGIDDKIFILFRDKPETVYTNWQFFRKHKKPLNRMVEMYFDEVPLMKEGFERICRSKESNTKCKEIYNLFKENQCNSLALFKFTRE